MEIKEVTLVLTKCCNLRCQYCYVRKNDSRVMTLETAQAIITKEFTQKESKGKKIIISFLGGEPFGEFERLKEICEWIWSKKWDVTYSITAVTNGTLLTDQIKSWLRINHKRFYLTLSYDGFFGAQNLNRCNSNEVIDLDFFHDLWPGIPVKMTIAENCVENLYDNMIYLHDKGIPVNDTFADNVPKWSAESLEKLDVQFEKLSIYYLAHPEVHASDLLSIDLLPVLYSSKRELFQCGAGETKITYDVDGQSYRCHLLSPLALSEKEIDDLTINLENKCSCEECDQCILDPICPLCEGMSYISMRNCRKREEKTCSLFQHQVYYACYFQMRKILQKEKIDDYDRLVFLAIKRILSGELINRKTVDGDY